MAMVVEPIRTVGVPPEAFVVVVKDESTGRRFEAKGELSRAFPSTLDVGAFDAWTHPKGPMSGAERAAVLDALAGELERHFAGEWEVERAGTSLRRGSRLERR
jgi:hypothetical protein